MQEHCLILMSQCSYIWAFHMRR